MKVFKNFNKELYVNNFLNLFIRKEIKNFARLTKQTNPTMNKSIFNVDIK